MSWRRFDIYLVNPEAALAEGHRGRPCVIVSPDEMNAQINTVIVAPLTTRGRAYPTRIPCHVAGKDSFIVLDQLRTVEKSRLTRRLGRLPQPSQVLLLEALAELFAE